MRACAVHSTCISQAYESCLLLSILVALSKLNYISPCCQVNKIFEEENPESAFEETIDVNLGGSYRIEDVYKVA